MVTIAPFEALFFSDKAGSITQLVTPPYDVITQSERDEFRKNPHNIIHAVMAPSPQSAAQFLSSLISQKLIVHSGEPGLYLYSVTFNHNKKTHTRLGLVGLLNLEEYGHEVFPHEKTIKEYVANTFNNLKATNTNFNPIFVIYPHDPQLSSILERVSTTRPIFDVKDKDSVIHRVWRIPNYDEIQLIIKLFKGKSVVIADGHHRYEAGLAHSKEGGSKEILTLFVDSEAPGLHLSTHCRLLPSLPIPNDLVMEKLEEYCHLESMKDLPSLQKAMDGRDHSFGLYLNKFFLMTLKDIPLDDLIPEPMPQDLKELDVTILHHAILPKIFGIHSSDGIKFTRDPEKAIGAVHAGSAQAAILLKSLSVQTVMRVSELGETTPPKSTFFFPKPLSGLVMYKADL